MACPARGVIVSTGEPPPKSYKLTAARMSDGDPSVSRTLTVIVHARAGSCAFASKPKKSQSAHNARKGGLKATSGRVERNRAMGSLRGRNYLLPMLKMETSRADLLGVRAADCTPLECFHSRSVLLVPEAREIAGSTAWRSF